MGVFYDDCIGAIGEYYCKLIRPRFMMCPFFKFEGQGQQASRSVAAAATMRRRSGWFKAHMGLGFGFRGLGFCKSLL